MQALSDHIKIVEALDYASGTDARNGAVVDRSRFEGVLCAVHFATIATGASAVITVEQGDAANGSDMVALDTAELAVADDDDNKVFYVDLVRATKRYVRVVVTKAVGATAESAAYYLYNPLHAVTIPITNADGIQAFGPAEVAAE